MAAIASGPGSAEDAALEKWLALTPEHPLEPQLRFIDPHHHLWDARAGEGGAHITLDRGDGEPVDPAAVSYGAPNPAGCQQRYLLEDVMNDARGMKLVASVFVECGAMYSQAGPRGLRSTGETFFAQGVAAAAASGTYGRPLLAAGITGYLDLSLPLPELEAALLRHKQCPNFRGIRSSPTDVGLGVLQKHGVLFETGLSESIIELAAKFPQLTIVINHCCPRVGNGAAAIEEWKATIAKVAKACGPNVVAKMGGAGMPSCGFGWANLPRPPTSEEVAAATLPYYGHLLDCFGANRVMAESNFPVDKLSFSYVVCWNAFARVVQAKDLSTSDREAVFFGTAARVYKLAVPAPNPGKM